MLPFGRATGLRLLNCELPCAQSTIDSRSSHLFHECVTKAKSIDTLYADVAGCDIALTDEAPLALALDNRVDSPRIGRLAATPRSHAAYEMFPDDLRPLFFEAIEATDPSWKQAVSALERTIDCWTATGNREAILDYDEFNTEPIHMVVELLSKLKSSYRATEKKGSGR